jgi:hypothetical protein
MQRQACHVIVPAVLPAIFFAIAATPVDVLGCLNRGLLALAVASVSGLMAVGTAIIGMKCRNRRDAYAPWWAVSSGILVIPVIALIILA